MRHDGVVHALLLFLLDVIDFAHHGSNALSDVALALGPNVDCAQLAGDYPVVPFASVLD
jgi:hypothetical protein